MKHGPLTEEEHYYPFGLTMAGISDEALQFGKYNCYEYNSIEFDNDLGLNEYEALFRNLDPQTGRWWQVDPKPDYSLSMYSSMGDNPVLNMDNLGDTLTLGTSALTNTFIISLAGDYSDVVDIDANNRVSINYDKAKAKFTDKKGNLNQKKYDKYLDGAKANAGVQLLSDLSTDTKNYSYDAGWSTNENFKSSADDSWSLINVDYSDRKGKIIAGSPGQNVSNTP